MSSKLIYNKFRDLHPLLVTPEQKYKRVDNKTIKIMNKGNKSIIFSYKDDDNWEIKHDG